VRDRDAGGGGVLILEMLVDDPVERGRFGQQVVVVLAERRGLRDQYSVGIRGREEDGPSRQLAPHPKQRLGPGFGL
jgi:hypothetical protein